MAVIGKRLSQFPQPDPNTKGGRQARKTARQSKSHEFLFLPMRQSLFYIYRCWKLRIVWHMGCDSSHPTLEVTSEFKFQNRHMVLQDMLSGDMNFTSDLPDQTQQCEERREWHPQLIWRWKRHCLELAHQQESPKVHLQKTISYIIAWIVKNRDFSMNTKQCTNTHMLLKTWYSYRGH